MSRTRRLLIIEDNDIERQAIIELIGNRDLEIETAAKGHDAMGALLVRPFDCVILDLWLPHWDETVLLV